MLAPFSILWLVNEIAYMEEPVQVYTVGERTQLPLRLPVGWQHIRTEGESHQADIESAENLISPSPEVIHLSSILKASLIPPSASSAICSNASMS